MSDLIDRDYMLSQIEKAKAENRPFDYDSLIDFVKVLPNANKIKLEKIKAKVKNYIIFHEEWFDDIYQLESCLIGIDDIFEKLSELEGDKQ